MLTSSALAQRRAKILERGKRAHKATAESDPVRIALNQLNWTELVFCQPPFLLPFPHFFKHLNLSQKTSGAPCDDIYCRAGFAAQSDQGYKGLSSDH